MVVKKHLKEKGVTAVQQRSNEETNEVGSHHGTGDWKISHRPRLH